MSEPVAMAATPASAAAVATPGAAATDSALPTASAGAMLRAARQRQGLHIVALAAAIKVAPAKLEALEFDRYDELTDATFTRALALSVCRVLKIDAAPVLAKLPSAVATRLEGIDGGLNMPFRERPGLIGPADASPLRQPVLWLVVLLLLGAAAFMLLPPQPWMGLSDLLPGSAPTASPAPALPAARGEAGLTPPASVGRPGSTATAASGAAAAAPAAPAATTLAAPPALSSAASAVVPPVSTGMAAHGLGLRASAPSWVQVIDADGRTLLERVLGAGESIELDGALPLKLRIGNAQGVELRFRGQPVDLAPATSKNIAQIELR